MSSDRSVVVIGIDGLPPEVLNHYISSGVFKEIGAIVEKGLSAELKSVHPPVTGPAWMSMLTGCQPSKHGVQEFLMPNESLDQLVSGAYFLKPVASVFDILQENSMTSVAINMPHSMLLARDIPSAQVVGDLLTQDDSFFYPSDLQERYPEIGSYLQTPDPSEADISGSKKYVSSVREVERRRFQIGKKIFLDSRPDFFFYLISGSDWAMHNSFSRIFESKSNEVHELFAEIDSYVGWFSKQIGDDGHLIILSDHGFRAMDGVLSVNGWLSDMGYISTSSRDVSPNGGNGGTLHGKEIERRRRQGTSVRVPQILLRLMNTSSLARRLALVGARWLRRFNIGVQRDWAALDVRNGKAYCPTSETFGIYLNSTSKFSDGVLDDRERDSLADTLSDELIRMKDDEGRPVFEWVSKNDEADGPDIRFYPSSFQPVSRVLPEPILRMHNYAAHSDTGIFITDKPYTLKDGVEHMSLVDVLPVICALLGCEIPEGIDGAVPFSDMEEQAETRVYQKVRPSNNDGHSPEDTELLERRLKEMGYLE